MKFIYLIFFSILYVLNFVMDFFRYIGAAVRYIFFKQTPDFTFLGVKSGVYFVKH